MHSDTLIIKHLPNTLKNEEKEDLMKHFGAIEVKCISSKVKKYNVVFARFKNEAVAEEVLRKLHQICVLGSYLSVEYAVGKQFGEIHTNRLEKKIEASEEDEEERHYNQFLDRLNSWHYGVNFHQPIPSHLKYQYPPPDDLVLSNIAKVLASVPKFYTQVLHLMNKMNLPCPFGKKLLPDFKLHLNIASSREKETALESEAPAAEEVMDIAEESEESSESELSSDEDTKQQRETIPAQVKAPKKKAIKVPKFVKPVLVQPPTKKKKATFEEIFEKVSDETESKRIKLSYPPLEIVSTVQKEQKKTVSITETEVSGFGYIHPVTKPEVVKESKIDIRDEREEERLEREEIVSISSEDLAANRISEKDRSFLPVFKNYAEGVPTCRLYIKNLAKTVTEQDLRYIYNRYLSQDIELEQNMFDIRLMQEGRMKGQAFVTLQSVQLAQCALKETNGFILKDKPLVVQFARSATK